MFFELKINEVIKMRVKYWKFTVSQLTTKWILLDSYHPLKQNSLLHFINEVNEGKIKYMGSPIKIIEESK